MLTAQLKKNNFFCLIYEHFNVFNALKGAVKHGFVLPLLMS
jgi:hypothetical protein